MTPARPRRPPARVRRDLRRVPQVGPFCHCGARKRELEDSVAELEFERDLDSGGEPAMWVWVIIKADAPEHVWSWESLQRIRTRIVESLRAVGLQEWVYVRFREAGEYEPE